MKLNNFKQKIFFMAIVVMLVSNLNSINAETMEFMVRNELFHKDKEWKVTFNVPLGNDALEKIGVYKDFTQDNKVEGIEVSFSDKKGKVVSIKPPVGGYDRGEYYIMIRPGIDSEKGNHVPFQKKLIIRFVVETNELKGAGQEKNIFKHYAVDDKLREVETWVKNNKDDRTYDSASDINIDNINKLGSMVDIYNMDKISRTEIQNKIRSYRITGKIKYNKNGQAISTGFYQELEKNTYVSGVAEQTHIEYGIVTTRSDLKSFPTNVEFHRLKRDKFDRIQETALEAGEGVAILHQSKDGEWYFVQGRNYYGWIQKNSVGKADKKVVEEFDKAENFIVILEDRVSLEIGEREYFYSMGVKLPIGKSDDENMIISIPTVDGTGKLIISRAFIGDIDYSKGYLDLTRENIIKQAFKLQGTEYSWGDKGKGRDCSSTMMGIYRTMGIYLPRNTDEQERSNGESIRLSGLRRSDRYEKNDQLETGDLLFLKGHEVMYLGRYDGKDYIIHNFTGATMKSGGRSRSEEVFRVGITPIDMLSGSGASYIDMYTSYLKIIR